MTTKNTANKYTFTANRIAGLRDEEQLSWAKVAEALALGSPGAARRAYSALVRPHTDSVLLGHATATTALKPVDLASADLDAVRKAIVGKTIVVQRANSTEDIAVAKVSSLKAGTINFNDGNKSRAVKAEAVIGIK